MADIFNFSDRWDTAQVFESIRVNVTDTASLAGSSLIYFDISGSVVFRVDKNGDVVLTGSIVDSSNNELVSFGATPSAVNEITIQNAVTGAGPIIKATGDDLDIDLTLAPLGSGAMILSGLKYPKVDGSVNQVIETDGAGTLSFATPSSGGVPGGADTQIQFNNSGAFGGSANLTWDGSALAVNNFSISTAIATSATRGASISNIAGTESAAVYGFVGSTNTGMYSITTGVLGFATNGTEAIAIGATQGVILQPGASTVALSIGLNATPGDSIVVKDAGTNDIFRVNGLGEVSVGGVLPVAGTKLLLPQEDDDVTPTVAFGNGSTGFYAPVDDNIFWSLGGTVRFIMSPTEVRMAGLTGGWNLPLEVSSSTNPCFAFKDDDDTGIGRAAANQLSLITGSTERMRLDDVGNVKIAGSAAHASTAGTNVLSIFNGTSPVGTLTNGASLFVSGGEMSAIDAGGNVTPISPHDPETGEWIFYSKNTVTGRTIRFRMEELMRRLADLVGPDLFEESYEDVKSR